MSTKWDELRLIFSKVGLDAIDDILYVLKAVDSETLAELADKANAAYKQYGSGSEQYKVAFGDLVTVAIDQALQVEMRAKEAFQKATKEVGQALFAGFIAGLLK